MASFKGRYKTHDNLNSELVRKAEKLQNLLDTTGLHITSGFRTPAHNKTVGGWDKSYHLKGMALDIGRASFKENPQELYTKSKMAGFGGVIIYETHVHVDIGPNYFDDKRSGNGKYDKDNFVKVNTAKVVDIKNTSIDKTIENVVSSASIDNTQMSTPIVIGILMLAVGKVVKTFFE